MGIKLLDNLPRRIGKSTELVRFVKQTSIRDHKNVIIVLDRTLIDIFKNELDCGHMVRDGLLDIITYRQVDKLRGYKINTIALDEFVYAPIHWFQNNYHLLVANYILGFSSGVKSI